MLARCILRWAAAMCALGLVVAVAHVPHADAATLQCTYTATPAGTQLTSPLESPSAGSPCWTDVMPYPFGSDGNPVDPNSPACAPSADGPGWVGDYALLCYEQVTSMAFRAWNRGLAATQIAPAPGNTITPPLNAYGVWLYNGTTWFPDPTFPGSSVCPGTTILWAGKLDYWLIGGPTPAGSTTLCHFDGVNLDWEPLTIPTATIDRLPLLATGAHYGGITAGTCLAFNDCWFFGTDGIRVHWDGAELADAASGLGLSPWLEGNATSAASTTTVSGAQLGIVANTGQYALASGSGVAEPPLPPDPSSSALDQLFGLQGGGWAPLVTPPSVAGSDLAAVGMDGSGDTWIASQPAASASSIPTQPAPLTALASSGAEVCQFGAAEGLTYGTQGGTSGYQWTSLGVVPGGGGGTVVAGGSYTSPIPLTEGAGQVVSQVSQPAVVQAGCGGSANQTLFERPNPLLSDQTPADQTSQTLIPADPKAVTGAVAASADNDAWAAAGAGQWIYAFSQVATSGSMAPHLYQYTDGQTPNAPAGDDNETRPSLFTLSPPVYQVVSPTIVKAPAKHKIVKKKLRPRRLPPAVFAIRTKLSPGVAGRFTLRLLFMVRRPVTLGLEVLHGRRVVARTPLKRFWGGPAEISVHVDRAHWPTSLKFLSPKGGSH